MQEQHFSFCDQAVKEMVIFLCRVKKSVYGLLYSSCWVCASPLRQGYMCKLSFFCAMICLVFLAWGKCETVCFRMFLFNHIYIMCHPLQNSQDPEWPISHLATLQHFLTFLPLHFHIYHSDLTSIFFLLLLFYLMWRVKSSRFVGSCQDYNEYVKDFFPGAMSRIMEIIYKILIGIVTAIL